MLNDKPAGLTLIKHTLVGRLLREATTNFAGLYQMFQREYGVDHQVTQITARIALGIRALRNTLDDCVIREFADDPHNVTAYYGEVIPEIEKMAKRLTLAAWEAQNLVINVRIPAETITKISEAVNIAEVIGNWVDLEKIKTGDYCGVCPFCDEKRRTFYVSPSRGIFHCFACSGGGSAFSFVMKKMGMSFIDAVRFLGMRYGVLGESSQQQGEHRP